MTFEETENILKSHKAIRLLAADNAPLLISFFSWVFKEPHAEVENGAVAEKQLSDWLADYLYALRERGKLYPKAPLDYLTDWTNAGYLRKYVGRTDLFYYELTPVSEQVFKWMDSLTKREFVGTESRLKYLFECLRDLVSNTQMSAEERLQHLEMQKREIEQQMERLRSGVVDMLDDRQVKESYYQIEDTAKSLLGDFRQVEQNFRDLDRDFRRKIITTTQTKGAVLADLFEQQDFLAQTDQGKSFAAFWEFLLSPEKQAELEDLLQRMFEIPVVRNIRTENFRMEMLRNYLIEAGDRTNKTTNSLWRQLRRYLEHRSFFENKRIHEQISEGLKLMVEHPEVDFTKLPALEIEELVKVDLIAERPLYMPKQPVKFKKQLLQHGVAAAGEDTLLYEQFAIDVPLLKEHIAILLRNRDSLPFRELLEVYPIEKGIAEVVAYMDIALKSGGRHRVDDQVQEEVIVEQPETHQKLLLTVPQITFNR